MTVIACRQCGTRTAVPAAEHAQHLAVRALELWASVDRDNLIRLAHASGVSKHRIHTITGIARTTIDRILAHQEEGQ